MTSTTLTSYRTLTEALLSAPSDRAFATMWRADGDIDAVTFGQFVEKTQAQARRFLALGIERGDSLILILPQGIPLMVCFAAAWFVLLITGTLSGYWYQAVLTKKLPYSAGLRDLEEKRAAQERVTLWQDRFYYLNVVAAVLAALGGAMAKF